MAIDDSADYLENADRFGELYPEVEQVETVKITAYYPESADIEAITKQVNERLAELTDFGLETGDIHLATRFNKNIRSRLFDLTINLNR